MPSLTRSRQLSTKFDKLMPQVALETTRVVVSCLWDKSFFILQMMGLSADEANLAKDVSWSELLKKKEWEENAWWVEGKLHELLVSSTMIRRLANRLHHPREARRGIKLCDTPER